MIVPLSYISAEIPGTALVLWASWFCLLWEAVDQSLLSLLLSVWLLFTQEKVWNEGWLGMACSWGSQNQAT